MTDYTDNVVPLRNARVFEDDGNEPEPLDDTMRRLMVQTFAGTDIDCAAIRTQGQYRQAMEYMFNGILNGPNPGENILAWAMNIINVSGQEFSKLDGFRAKLCGKAMIDMSNGVPGSLEKMQRVQRILRSGLQPVGPGHTPSED